MVVVVLVVVGFLETGPSYSWAANAREMAAERVHNHRGPCACIIIAGRACIIIARAVHARDNIISRAFAAQL